MITYRYKSTKLRVGTESLEVLPSLLDDNGCQRIMVVAGSTTGSKATLMMPLREALGDRHVLTYTGGAEDVPLSNVQTGVEMTREHDIDGLVSLGGGSNHDTAKAIAELAGEPGGLHDVKAVVTEDGELEVPSNTAPKVPIFTIATTLTGAELTNSIAVTDDERDENIIIMDDKIRPQACMYNPEFTKSTPSSILSNSAMNAVNHAVEILYSSTLGDNPFYQANAEKAIPMLFESLPALVGRNGSHNVISHAHAGGILSAMGITDGYCINHCINQSLSARYSIRHGEGDGIVLPYGISFNFTAVPGRIERIASAMDVDTKGSSDDEMLDCITERIRNFQSRLGMPTQLRETDASRSDFEDIADEVIRNPGIAHNPRAVSRDDVIRLLEKAW